MRVDTRGARGPRHPASALWRRAPTRSKSASGPPCSCPLAPGCSPSWASAACSASATLSAGLRLAAATAAAPFKATCHLSASEASTVATRATAFTVTSHPGQSYYWFMLAMQLITLLGLLVLSCVRLLAASALAWLSWLVVLTALFLQGSDTLLAVTELADKESLFGHTHRYARLASAGWIFTSILNFALMWITGFRPRKLIGGGATSVAKY